MPMHMEAFLWLFLPVFVAGGSALLSFYIMQARMEVALAKERESLAEARAIINSHKAHMEERIRATEEATRRAALDELMQDFRFEERSYVRESKALARRSMVMQERVFFRNIPLSTWMEHEMLIEDGGTTSSSPESLANLATATLAHGVLPNGDGEAPASRLAISKSLDRSGERQAAEVAPREEARPKRPAPPRESRALVPAHAAFGAQ